MLLPEEGSRQPKHAADSTVSLHTFCSFYDRKQAAAPEREGHDPRWKLFNLWWTVQCETVTNKSKLTFLRENMKIGAKQIFEIELYMSDFNYLKRCSPCDTSTHAPDIQWPVRNDVRWKAYSCYQFLLVYKWNVTQKKKFEKFKQRKWKLLQVSGDKSHNTTFEKKTQRNETFFSEMPMPALAHTASNSTDTGVLVRGQSDRGLY